MKMQVYKLFSSSSNWVYGEHAHAYRKPRWISGLTIQFDFPRVGNSEEG